MLNVKGGARKRHILQLLNISMTGGGVLLTGVVFSESGTQVRINKLVSLECICALLSGGSG